MTPASAANLYDRLADQTASLVIRRYSTSFGLASGLLGAGIRQSVANIYALVRVADEIVDGGAAGAGLGRQQVERMLDAYEAETERALGEGYSADLVVHAFARTARDAGFGTELTKPFFASMRADLHETQHDPESFAAYVYGSAEVVGLMCLRVFLKDAPRAHSPEELAILEAGARSLGAAFQKVNFLRDLAADHDKLGRSYFPGIDVTRLTEDEKITVLDDIDADLSRAAATLPLLPRSSRRAVALAHGLFAELSRRLRRTPAELLIRTRVRVPDLVKLRIALGAATGGGRS